MSSFVQVVISQNELKLLGSVESKHCLVCLRGCLGEGDMVGSMEGRQGRVYLEYVKGLTNKFAR